MRDEYGHMMSRRFFHKLCVLLLLLAQQGALMHATWHASGGAQTGRIAKAQLIHAQGSGDNNKAPSGQRGLCAFDLALGQVLGGVHGSCVPQIIAELPAALAIYPFNPRVTSEAVSAVSRGPPVLL